MGESPSSLGREGALLIYYLIIDLLPGRERSVMRRDDGIHLMWICRCNGGLEETKHVRAPICLRGITVTCARVQRAAKLFRAWNFYKWRCDTIVRSTARKSEFRLMYRSIVKDMTSTHVRQRRNYITSLCPILFFKRSRFLVINAVNIFTS